ncbi:MAG: hypothetical protein PHN35_06495 [Clostridia bacterium]|nr:hypothetical protein [Clostridia bacterium]
MNLANWEKRAQTGLSDEQILTLIEACRLAHNNHFSIGLAVGIRAAFRAIAELKADRNKHDIDFAQIKGNFCGALAFMIICSLNPLKEHKLGFELYQKPDWQVEVFSQTQSLLIKMHDRNFETAEAVLELPDSQIFAQVLLKDL